jgi:cell volume regulation protein A
VVFTLIQGPTLPYLARKLGITEEGATHEVTIESAPLDEVDATMMQLGVPPRSKLAGVYVSELRLPPGSLVSLVVRDGTTFVPDGTTALRGGDQLLLVTTNSNRRATERRLRAISRAGRLAGWYGERGDPEPPQTPPPAGRTTLVGPAPDWSAGRDETQTAGTPR